MTTPSPAAPVRSSPLHWWGTRTGRFVLLLVGLAALLLAPIHLNPDSALWVGIGGLAALALLGLARVRRLVARVRDRTVTELHVLGRAVPSPAMVRDIRTLDSVVRAVGLALPALVFFVAWALLYAVIWAADPHACAVATSRCDGAFVGLGSNPILGDFVYYAVNIAFANPPPDVVAQSRLARAAGTVEIVAGAGFVAAYLGVVFATRAAARPAAKNS